MRVRSAPVKAPRTCPNSSDSARASGMAAMFMATKGPPARGLEVWISRATTSLPVPVSPRMRTLASVSATWSMRSSTRRMAG